MAKTLLFDLLGTLIHHETRQALPMMPFMLRRLAEKDYQVAILTSYDHGSASEIVAGAGLPPLKLFAGSDRADLVRQALSFFQEPDTAWYFDDKPAGLIAVQHSGFHPLQDRVCGFIGSRKYCSGSKYSPTLPASCKKNRLPLALFPYDIVEVINEGEIFEEFCGVSPSRLSPCPALQPEEVAFLLPGLETPCSVFGGYKRAINAVFDAPRDRWEPIWRNLGWIGTADSIFTLMVRSAARELGMAPERVTGEDAHAILQTVRSLVPEHDRRRLCGLLRQILGYMEEGIAAIGIEAEGCRPAACKHFEMDRIEDIRARLSLCELDVH